MEIINLNDNVYIQQCKFCGSVLKYSESDIYKAGKSHCVEDLRIDLISFLCSEDVFICPTCEELNTAKRKTITQPRGYSCGNF